MTYIPAQALLRTRLLTLTGYFNGPSATNDLGDVVEGNYLALDRGSANVAVLTPASIPDHDLVNKRVAVLWGASVDLFRRWNPVANNWYDFGVVRDAVITCLEDGRCLSQSYWITSITADDPDEVTDSAGNGPFFIWQRLNLTIQENI